MLKQLMYLPSKAPWRYKIEKERAGQGSVGPSEKRLEGKLYFPHWNLESCGLKTP